MNIVNCDLFLQGQKDCADGISHEEGMPEDYNRGYAAQYELEQTITDNTKERIYAS